MLSAEFLFCFSSHFSQAQETNSIKDREKANLKRKISKIYRFLKNGERKRETPKPITIEFQPFSLMEFSLFFASSTFHLGKDKLVNKKRLEVVIHRQCQSSFLKYINIFFQI